MQEVILPEGAIESATSYFWIRDGIIFIMNKPKNQHDINDAKDNVVITGRLADNVIYPLLIDISKIKFMTREAREVYAAAGVASKYKAVALISSSPVSRILGNFFMRFNKPGIPTKLFSNHTDAKKWLEQF